MVLHLDIMGEGGRKEGTAARRVSGFASTFLSDHILRPFSCKPPLTIQRSVPKPDYTVFDSHINKATFYFSLRTVSVHIGPY